MVCLQKTDLFDIKDEIEGSFLCPLCSELFPTPEPVRLHLLGRHCIELPLTRRLQNFGELLVLLRSLIFPVSSTTDEEGEGGGTVSVEVGLPPSPTTHLASSLSPAESGSVNNRCGSERMKTEKPFIGEQDRGGVIQGKDSAALPSSSPTPPPLLWHCPVCRSAVGNFCNSLELHCSLLQHHLWNRRSVDGMSAFYKAEELEDVTDEDIDERDPVQEGREPLSDQEDGEWEEEEPMRCLFCSYEGVDCLDHMLHIHHFDLKDSTHQRAEDIKDEYDLIRLVNMVRSAVASGQCPFHISEAQEVANEEDTEKKKDQEVVEKEEKRWSKEACALEIVKSDLEAHLLDHPSHRLPQCIRQHKDDKWLIPVLPGDTLISHLMTAGEGFLAEETLDPNFPVVPTVLQLAEKRRKDAELKRNAVK